MQLPFLCNGRKAHVFVMQTVNTFNRMLGPSTWRLTSMLAPPYLVYSYSQVDKQLAGEMHTYLPKAAQIL